MSYNGRESARINAKEPPLGQYVEDADYVIFKEEGVIKAKDGSNGSIAFQGTDFSTVVNDAILATPKAGKIVFKTTPKHEITHYYISSPIKIPDNHHALYLEAQHNSLASFKLEDGANCNMFEIGTESQAFILHLEGMRLLGNKANNTSGNGIVNYRGKELQLYDCEIKEFPEHGLLYDPKIDLNGWHYFSNLWTLDHGGAGVKFNITTDLTELIWNGGYIRGDPCISIPDIGTALKNLLVTDCRLYGEGAGSKVVNALGGQQMQFTDNLFYVGGDGLVFNKAGHAFLGSVKDNFFVPKTGENPQHAISLLSSGSEVSVKHNRITNPTAFAGAIIENPGNGLVRNNTPRVTLASGTVTHTTGSSTRVDAVAANELDKIRAIITPASAGQVAADYAIDWHFEWDNSAGNWDLVLTWVTDPGSDMNFDYKVVYT